MARIRTTTIRKGSYLYHGTSVREDFDIPDGPAWFSDAIDVAQNFVGWHEGPRPRVLTFRVEKNISRLVQIEDRSEMDNLVQRLLEESNGDTGELVEALCGGNYSGWHIPYNYPYGSDTMLCYPESFLELVEVEVL